MEQEKIEFEIPKQSVYCGNDEITPDGYSRLGSRIECMRKGYGSALYNAPIEYINKVRNKKKKIRILTKAEVNKIAKRLNIKIENQDIQSLTNEIIRRLTILIQFLNENNIEEEIINSIEEE